MDGNKKREVAVGLKQAASMSPEERLLRWSDDVHLKRWEMPMLCADLNNADLGITHLRLDGNGLTMTQVEELAGALASNTSLNVLSVAGCGLTGRHAAVLARGLKGCRIHHLSVWGNAIGDDGAQALADALPSCSSLQSLDCGQNMVGDEGARALLAVLPQCKHLHTFNIGYNPLSTNVALDFAKHFETHATLKFLGLRGTTRAPAPAAARAIRRAQRQVRPRVLDTDALPYHRAFDWKRASTLRSYLHRPQHVLADDMRVQALDLQGWS